jgi:hypothetical protein
MEKGRLAFLFVVFLISATLVKATDITECTNITSPGTYNIINDILGEQVLFNSLPYGACINIDSNDVILNCQNYDINAQNSSTGQWAIPITVIRDTPTNTNITIENCFFEPYDSVDLAGPLGIYLENASFNNIINITEIGGQSAAGTGGGMIQLVYSDSNTLDNITIVNSIDLGEAYTGSGGIGIHYSNNVTVANAYFYNDSPYGIGVDNSNDSNFTNITAIDINGLDWLGGWDASLGAGIAVSNSNNDTFTNIITAGVLGNSVGTGIYLYSSSSNQFSNVTTYSNSNYGIFLDYSSSNNAFSHSAIQNNTNYGIYIEASSANGQYTEDNIFHNNFINNTANFGLCDWDIGYNYCDNTTLTNYLNISALLGGGNFWVPYSMNCTDANGDGFCDTPYDALNNVGCIGNCSNNTDFLPLAYLSCGMVGLNITTYDELTNQQIYFNAYITNGTANLTVTNVWEFNETGCNASLPTGNVTVAISNASYYGPRPYFGYIGLAILKAYLLPLNDSNAVLATFIVQDAGTSPMQGIYHAVVEVYKDFGGWPVLMLAGYTDGIGSISAYLDSKTQYVANASAIGFFPKSVAASFANTSVIYIPLNRLSYGLGFPNPYSDVNWTLLPENHDLYQDQNVTTFIFTISSKNGTLTNYGMNITNASGTLLSTGSGSAAYGGSLSSIINQSANSGYLNVTIWFLSPTYAPTPFIQTIKYVIYPNSNGIGQQILGHGGLIATSGMSLFAMGLLALIISLAVCGAFSTIGFSIGKGGVIFTVVMTVFAGLGFLSGGLWLELILIQISFVVIRWL